jgi:hypothetical protein
MAECASAGTALSSDAGSDLRIEFLTVILQDEEWLEAEFDAVLSEPSESPRPPRRTGRVATERLPGGTHASAGGGSSGLRDREISGCNGTGWVRTRSPPRRPSD